MKILKRTSLNTALLVAILLLQMTKEPPRIQASPIQIAPAVAQDLSLPAVHTPAVHTVVPVPATVVETRTIIIAKDFSDSIDDPTAYYKAKARHLRAALMKKN